MSTPVPHLRPIAASEPAARPAIRIRNLIKTFGDLVAVDNMSLDIGQREFFMTVGPSGCGKITLLRILVGSGGMPTEGAGLAFPGDGIVELLVGSQSTGQAHASVFPRVAAQQLGIPVDRVVLRQGDSGLGVMSASTVASRSAVTVGTAIVRAAEAVIRKGRKLAADALEAAEADIIYDGGVFAVAGTDRRIGLFDLAKHAKDSKQRGEIAEDLGTKLTADTPQTFPNGCHIAEVEIDPETGATALVGYTAVDDCGNVLGACRKSSPNMPAP